MTGLSGGVFDDAPTNDLGWEVYPAGLAEQVRRLHDRYDLPVWVTENGTADNGKPQCGPGDEAFRCRFILDHLEQISHVISEGIPVERYYHWCFVDNWEWSEGMAARFGVVGLEAGSLDRVIKPSGWLLRDLIQAGAVTSEFYSKYAEPRGYR